VNTRNWEELATVDVVVLVLLIVEVVLVVLVIEVVLIGTLVVLVGVLVVFDNDEVIEVQEANKAVAPTINVSNSPFFIFGVLSIDTAIIDLGTPIIKSNAQLNHGAHFCSFSI